MRLIHRLALAALAVALSTVPTAPSRAAGSVTVSLNCVANPELTTIKNGTDKAITITRVGSIHQPLKQEPFAVNKTLKAGESVTYQTGNKATTNVLSKKLIYNNEAKSAEGARVATSAGTVEKRC